MFDVTDFDVGVIECLYAHACEVKTCACLHAEQTEQHFGGVHFFYDSVMCKTRAMRLQPDTNAGYQMKNASFSTARTNDRVAFVLCKMFARLL